MCTNPSTLDKSCKLSVLIVSMRGKLLTSFLRCSERSCLSLLLLLESFGILVILPLGFLGCLDNVEITYRCDLRAQERRTLRGFSFPPCLPDMVVVDVQNLCDARSSRSARDWSHAQSGLARFESQTPFLHLLVRSRQVVVRGIGPHQVLCRTGGLIRYPE